MIETFDMHNHSKYSHDSVCELTDLRSVQKERGSNCFAVTDHCDLHLSTDIDASECIKKCHQEIDILNSSIHQAPIILKGIEIGEGIWYPKIATSIVNTMKFDVILGSVHTVRSTKCCIPYSIIDFSLWSEDDIDDYLARYFTDVSETIETFEFDILTHLTCPLKYIPIKINISRFDDAIQNILLKIIKNNIALEVNTSYKEMIPSVEILKKYKALGGKLITLGSDSHIAQNAANNFESVYEKLKAIGFNEGYYFINRKIYKYNF